MEQDVLKIIKQSDKIVGTKQVLKGIEDGSIRCVVVSADTDDYILNKVKAAASKKNVKLLTVPTMCELGKACGIEVGAAVAGLK